MQPEMQHSVMMMNMMNMAYDKITDHKPGQVLPEYPYYKPMPDAPPQTVSLLLSLHWLEYISV